MLKENFGRRLILLILLLVSFILVDAQHNHEHDHEHDHELGHSHFDEHKYHFGAGAGVASFSGEDGLEPSLHLHLLRRLNVESKWSFGLGYEGIKGEEWHNGLNLLLNYRPFHFISFNAGPGLVFEKHDGENEILPAFHAESVVEFTVADFHFGPMIGFGINKEHTHFSFGIHLGFGI